MPARAGLRSKAPSGPASPGTSAGALAARPSHSTRWRPVASSGSARARATASSKAAPATIRLAVVRIPSRCADSIASFTARLAPKSSPVTTISPGMRFGARALAPLHHEGEELAPLAEPAPHDLAVAQHVAHDAQDRPRAEVELAVEALE